MQKLRISYTLLSLWHSKRYEDVLAYYTKKPTFQSDEMREGSGWDEIIEQTIKDTNKLPEQFGGLELVKPLCQPKLEVELNESIELVTKPDCVDDFTHIWYEFKTGTTSSEVYAGGMQISMYSLVAKLLDTPLQSIYIIHYNQYNNQPDSIIVHNHKNLGNKAYEYIKQEEANIRAFLTEKGII